MKIAIASNADVVAEHFGHCQRYAVFEVDRDNILGETSIDNPGHKPGFLPKFLHEQGVNVIISGGMGSRAVELFNEYGIETIVGAQGTVADAIKSYLHGRLEATGSICHSDS